ncbi:MAG: TIGR00304 family membrane protein [Methanocella sp.]|jgi:uncharacterized membrane protein
MLSSTDENDGGFLVSRRLLGLMIIGVSLVFLGVAIVILVTVFSGSGSVGGVILIGPIPIFFGAGPDSTVLIAIAAVLTIISVLLFLVMNRRR